MKKPSTWAAIIGGILTASSLYQLANSLTHLTDLFWVNTAIIVTNLLWIALGIFLITIYLRGRQKEDAGHVAVKAALDSPEDVEVLKKQRRWIFAFVIFVEVIGSVGSWILNNYAAGPTLINVETIFDILLNVVLFYLVIEMLRNKRNILNLFFYTIIVYGLGGTIIELLRHHWYWAVISALFALYFAYAIKAPLNRKNHRIAHVIILPAFIILSLAFSYFANARITELTKKDELLGQQFSNDTGTLTAAYQRYLQWGIPDAKTIQDVRYALEERDKRAREIVDNLNALKEAHGKELPSILQKKALERIRHLQGIISVHREQAEKLSLLMDYSEKVDFYNPSDQQLSDISNLIKEVNSYINKLTDVEFKLNNANLNN